MDELTRLTAPLSDRYRLDRELGRGGMATVFLAEDLRNRRFVALKVLHPAITAGLGSTRFLHEIEIAARLVHPHIVSVLDSGEAGGVLYYAMPYVPGDTLRARLRREGELPIDAAVRVWRELLDALAHAHALGIVHRDIKPENVLFLGLHVQVADFGIAKALSEADPNSPRTESGIAVGTPAYMSPEQAAADPQVDHRADIYAAGVVAYEMLAGVSPFTGANAAQIISAHITRRAEPLERVRPTVPPALAAVVMRCLEKRPADRWQSAEEILRELDRLTSGPITAMPLRAGRELASGSFRLSEEVCGRLDRSSFDPRMIGDAMEYLDNEQASDILVACVPACGLDAEQFAPFLRGTRHRAMVVTPFGFENNRRRRPLLTLRDHLVLIGEWLRAMAARAQARVVVLTGFSSGGDVVLGLAAGAAREDGISIHGCVPLGANLALETCFVTRVLATMGGSQDTDTLAALRGLGQGTQSLDEWINVHDYLVHIARKFRGSLECLQMFARDIVRPFEQGPLTPFVEWYRAAARRGCRLRCVFDDWSVYRGLVRQLQLRNLDEAILGGDYEEESIVIDAEALHFDLLQPARIERHVDEVVRRIRAAPAAPART